MIPFFLPFDLAEDVDATQQNVGYLCHKAKDIKEVNLVDSGRRCRVAICHVALAGGRRRRQLILHEILQVQSQEAK